MRSPRRTAIPRQPPPPDSRSTGAAHASTFGCALQVTSLPSPVVERLRQMKDAAMLPAVRALMALPIPVEAAPAQKSAGSPFSQSLDGWLRYASELLALTVKRSDGTQYQTAVEWHAGWLPRQHAQVQLLLEAERRNGLVTGSTPARGKVVGAAQFAARMPGKGLTKRGAR